MLNQIEIIKHISKSLPIGYRLYVKEHPLMIIREWRKTSFYNEILSIPNVQFLHHSIKTEDVMTKCSLVITINGASGLEAAIYKKPSILFSDFSYSILPAVHQIKSIDELPAAIRLSLRKKVDPIDVDKYLSEQTVEQIPIYNQSILFGISRILFNLFPKVLYGYKTKHHS
mgnify:CR=1 FL=1